MSNESQKVGREGRLEAGSQSAPGAARPGGGAAASQKGRPAGRKRKTGEEGGAENRKERLIEEIGEQRALIQGEAVRGR